MPNIVFDLLGKTRRARRRRVAVVLTATAILGTVLVAGVGAAPDSSRPNEQGGSRRLAQALASARVATAPYANDLDAAKADGYTLTITQMIPDMGWHFLNPNVSGFDVTRPPILVYVRDGDDWQLVAFEWVFTEKPEEDPLPGATYGSFGAACHYEDGTFVFMAEEEFCPDTSPSSSAAFLFWHPDLITLHLWAWYPNPKGIFNGTNPLIQPFNED
jgi:hypothetical protein